jgi:dihydroorotate dehydrogenase
MLGEKEVDEVLDQKGLQFGNVHPTHALLQLDGTVSHRPCAIFVVEVEGKPVAVKLTVDMLVIAARAMASVVEKHMPPKGTQLT